MDTPSTQITTTRHVSRWQAVRRAWRDAQRHETVKERYDRGIEVVAGLVVAGGGALILDGLAGLAVAIVGGALTIVARPAWKTFRGWQAARDLIYSEQVKPDMDALHAEIRQRDDVIREHEETIRLGEKRLDDQKAAWKWYMRYGVVPIPLDTLTELESATVRKELEKAQKMIMEAASHANSALRSIADDRSFAKHIGELFIDTLIKQAGRLGSAQDEFRNRLGSEDDARQSLHALCRNYQRTSRCIRQCVLVMPELSGNVQYQRWETVDGPFMVRILEILAISELEEVKRYLAASDDAFPL
jgi:hypothetical protein